MQRFVIIVLSGDMNHTEFSSGLNFLNWISIIFDRFWITRFFDNAFVDKFKVNQTLNEGLLKPDFCEIARAAYARNR